MLEKGPMRCLKWKNIVHESDFYHLARVDIAGGRHVDLHSQNFSELFWIEKGAALHRVNTNTIPLNIGDMVFMRSSDIHELTPNNGSSFVLVNLAFPNCVLEDLGKRYFGKTQKWFWSPDPMPESISLTVDRIHWLDRWVSRLASVKASRIEIDIFLMELFRELSLELSVRAIEDEPSWLTTLMKHLEEPSIMSGGTVNLARLAGRTPQHVNAAIKKYRGLTATQALNHARMEYAMRSLRTSTKKILEICFDCGFQNLSHFYEIFRKSTGMTPRDYRLQHQSPLR